MNTVTSLAKSFRAANTAVSFAEAEVDSVLQS
jgi:hypothetical protein